MKSPLDRIRIGAISLIVILTISVVGFRMIGGYDWLDAIWLVVITISTVGYSEQTDSTAAMQVFTMLVIVLGVTGAAYTCGGFIQLMLAGEVEKVLGRRKMTKEINRLSDHVVICGFGRMGQDLAKQLSHRGLKLVVIDNAANKVSMAEEQKLIALIGDATSEDVLQEARINNAQALVTALPTDAENVFITLTARNLCPEIQIIAKSEFESSCRKLRQAGANKIVMPHKIGAQRMERMITRPSVADLVELFAEASALNIELDEFRISDTSPLIGKTLAESKIKEEYRLLVVGIMRADGVFQFNPGPTDTINPSDTLVVMGKVDDVDLMKGAHMF